MSSNAKAFERPDRAYATDDTISVWVTNPNYCYEADTQDDSCICVGVPRAKAQAYAREHRCSIQDAARAIARLEVV